MSCMKRQAACALVLTLVLVAVQRLAAADLSCSQPQTNNSATTPSVSAAELEQTGRKLFGQNCAHCHGEDARGDEGPSLHNLKLSDTTVARRIKEGIKGEMPKFREKFSDREVQAIIVFIRSLKD